jgi:uncharacterized protein
MTRREQHGLGRCGRWEDLFATPDAGWRELLGDEKDSPEDWRILARRGAFPTPALELTTASERRIWFDGYVRTYLERDLHHLAAISGLPDLRRHMRAACPNRMSNLHQSDACLRRNLRIGDDLVGISGKWPLLVEFLRQRRPRRIAQ